MHTIVDGDGDGDGDVVDQAHGNESSTSPSPTTSTTTLTFTLTTLTGSDRSGLYVFVLDRNVSTGHGAWRTTFSATLPMSRWLSPVRPCVERTMRSVFSLVA